MFRNAFSLTLAMALAVTPFLETRCQAEEKPKHDPSYATPGEVFAAFQRGWKEKDGETVVGCLTEEHRGEILLREWAREFSLRFPGPRIERIVSKHADEKRRMELTRRELPTSLREFASALSRSLDDPKSAFLDLVKNLDEKSRPEYTAGQATDFTTSAARPCSSTRTIRRVMFASL